MKNLFLLLALFPVFIFGQTIGRCNPDLLFKVTASSGMKMREGPGQNNKVVFYVPAHNYLLVCKEKSNPATFEEKGGNWRRVRYKEHYGYMFDGFITRANSNMIINDSTWMVAELPDVQQILDSTQTKVDTAAIVLAQDSLSIAQEDSMSTTEAVEDSVVLLPLNPILADTLAETPEQPKVILPPTEYIFTVETYNYCGEINHLDPGIRWYGIYYDEDLKIYRNRRIELQIIRSKYALGTGLEFDVISEKGVSPHFMIGTKSKLDTNLEVDFDPGYFDKNPQSLFPGQQVNIYSKQQIYDIYNFTLFATGNVTDVGFCPEMDNYHLKLTGEMNDSLTVQDLTQDINYFGKCGMPKIYWFGDFNQDKYPDFILVSVGKDQTTFTLFVSDIRANGKLVRKAGEWSYRKCD